MRVNVKFLAKLQKFCMKILAWEKYVPKLLTPEQKEHRMRICSDTLENFENDPNLLQNVITCDETWIFQYSPETKRQSMHWKSPASPRKKKARMSKSKFKVMMIVFYDIKGIIYINWVPEGQTVNQVYYKDVLTTLRERVRRRRPEMWKNGSTHEHTMPSLWRRFSRNTRSQWWSTHRTRQIWHRAIFFCFLRWNLHWRVPGSSP